MGAGAVLVLSAVGLAVVLAVGAVLATPRVGAVTAWSAAALGWSLLAIGLATLTPPSGVITIVPAETRAASCSFDYGGPAPDGFWIFSGAQRALNTALFVPAGACWTLLCLRWPRAATLLVPLGVAALAAGSVGIEVTQLALARLDRACDVTDMVDNATGAALGVVPGLLLGLLLRPWRARRASA
ncbi:VanZ family protein [Marmoricola endophyticus]|nr:VanZ family protein [Marmoricola endophyticus]